MKTNFKFAKKIIGIPVFAGILFAGSFGINNLNNSNKKSVSNLISSTETISGLTDNKTNSPQISMGSYHSSALTNKGEVYTWGSNHSGQLGDGTNTNRNTPTNITNNFGLGSYEVITQLSMGTYHSSALTNKGNVYTWGHNTWGQLGNGTLIQKNKPTNITNHFSLSENEQITQLEMGASHSSALTNKGNVYTWGHNSKGQLGNGTLIDKNKPTKTTINFNLVGDEQITELSMGAHHSSALTNKGNVFTWGYGPFGQLGYGMEANNPTPTKITDNFNLIEKERITQLSMGDYHSSALTNKGNVFTWGLNDHGQLGDGTTRNMNIPTNITDNFFDLIENEQITQLNMGGTHSSALTNKGNVYTWGLNDVGQLGNGTTAQKNIPILKITYNFDLDEGEQITQLSMGTYHSSALTNKGNVFTWGDNGYGQVGIIHNYLIPGIIFHFSTISLEDLTTITTSNSVQINFTVNKNDQSGNVVVRDDDEIQKGSKDNIDGTDSIVIDNLESDTTFTGWTIEVDGNVKETIPDFETKVILSDIIFNNVTEETTNSVQMNFTVNKNDQNGNVVIRDDNEIQKGSKNNVDGTDSIVIDNLEAGTIFTGWTIEVDGNVKETIPDFETKGILSDITNIKPINIYENSADISFDLQTNNGQGWVKIFDDGFEIKSEKLTSGSQIIQLDNLSENTVYDKLTISVDDGVEKSIPSFKTLFFSYVSDINVTSITSNSAKVNFNLSTVNDKDEITILNNDQKISSKEVHKTGYHSIELNNLESNKEYNLSISVNNKFQKPLPSFTTQEYSSDDIDKLVEIKIKNKSNIKYTDTKITVTYSQKIFEGKGSHIVVYKNGLRQSLDTSPNQYSNSNFYEKTHQLHQPMDNIKKIDTYYEFNGYVVFSNLHSGTKDEIFPADSNSGSNPETSLLNTIRKVLLVTIIILVLFTLFIIFYYQLKKNKIRIKEKN